MKWVIFTLAMVWVSCVAVLPVCAANDDARVLILNGLDPYLPAYLAIDNAMRTSLAQESTKRIVLYSEPLDAQRFAVGPRESELVASLAKKYDGLQIDVVVTVMKPALDFYKKHGAALWPGARLVFHGLPDPAEETVDLPEHATGLVNRDDFAGTVALAQRLQPNARRILVISGVSPLDLELERRARQVVPAVAGTAAVEFLSGALLAELVARLAKEPADTIVLYLTQFRDREDRPYVPRQVLQAISAVSTAPVYGLFETYVGSGVAAGNMEFYEDRGQMVGQLVRDALAGEAPAAGRAVLSVPSRCIADKRALRRWALDEARLPEGCEIRFVERSLWREYRWQILGAIAILLFQTALIAGLLIERERRRRAAARAEAARVETGQYRENLAHLMRVHAVGEMSTAIAHEVNQPLAAIKNYAFAARRRLAGDAPEASKVEELLDKIETQAARAGDVLHSLRTMVKKHEPEPTRIEVGPFISDTLKLVEMECHVGDIRLESSIAPDLPPVFVDEIQIQQVVLNLTRNAIEAMEGMEQADGVIAVGVCGNGHGEVAVSVADSGPGIAPEDTERIFDPFYSTKAGGLGVGLSLCRAIVEAHGGRLSLKPSLGGGSVFQFTLPAMNKGA